MKDRKDFLEEKPEIGQMILWWHCQGSTPSVERFTEAMERIDGDLWQEILVEGFYIPTDWLKPLSEITEEDKEEFEKKFILNGWKVKHFENSENETTIFFVEHEIFTDQMGCSNNMTLWLMSRGYNCGQGEENKMKITQAEFQEKCKRGESIDGFIIPDNEGCLYVSHLSPENFECKKYCCFYDVHSPTHCTAESPFFPECGIAGCHYTEVKK